jgi:uncharacterized membrane protein
LTDSTAPSARALASVRPGHPRSSTGRLGLGVAAGFATAVLVALLFPGFGLAVHVVAGWDAGGLVILGLAWWLITSADAEEMRARAAAVDPGRRAVGLTVIASSVFSLFAAAFVMRQSEHLVPTRVAIGILSALCLVAVLVAWFLMHTAYTLRYAHLYYSDEYDAENDAAGEGGLEFPGRAAPDAFDFAYFAFTLGMCFQVSDVTVTSRAIRRTALGHALLSFLFNTAILAFALNLVFGVLNS